MHAISVKELRTKFPFVRSELKKGTTFLIIHQSKPIAELVPVKNHTGPEEDEATTLKAFEAAAIVDMNNLLGHDDCLTEEEIKYYLSLPPLK